MKFKHIKPFNEKIHVNQDVIFEKNIEREINYSDYIEDKRVEKRDKLIEELEKNLKKL